MTNQKLVKVVAYRIVRHEIFMPLDEVLYNKQILPSGFKIYKNVYNFLMKSILISKVAEYLPFYIDSKYILKEDDMSDLVALSSDDDEIDFKKLYSSIISNEFILEPTAELLDLSNPNILNQLPEEIKKAIIFNLSMKEANRKKLGREMKDCFSDYFEEE
jgi:hypothetical protein